MFYFSNAISALALPFLQIYPFLLFLIVATALLFNDIYIYSIGYDMVIFSELFYKSGLETVLPEISGGLLLSSLPPVKPKRLTAVERSQFTLSGDLQDILVGLIIGDLHVRKHTKNSNAKLRFEQGFVHNDYLFHLYELFESYCSTAPKISNRLPDKRTVSGG